MIALANYSAFLYLACPQDAGDIFCLLNKVLSVILVFTGGFFIAYNLLVCSVKKLKYFEWNSREHDLKPWVVFITLLLGISVPNMLLLFWAKYPGILTADSISQVWQATTTGNYSNHHPVYHTLVIKAFMTLGFRLFGEINAAVATYSFFQIFFMAACFSYVIVTLYQMKISINLIICCGLYYVIMPFHIMYSFTMWKDVVFGGTVLLFIVSVYRTLKKIGKYQIVNQLVMIIGSVGMCLFRSNGWFAYVLTCIGFVFIFRKKYTKMCLTFFVIVVMTFFLGHLLLGHLGIKQPDTIESLSIPAQQVSRVVVDCDDLTEAQRQLLNQIVDVDAIPETYKASTSDPIKTLVRASENQNFIIEHKTEFIKLYLELGISHPHKYIEAWIDETRGFWNAGYPGGKWDHDVLENNLGISSIVNSEAINIVLEEYLWLFKGMEALQIFHSIGFHVWIVLFIVFINSIRGDKVNIFVTIPLIAIILSLVLATPVYGEFRYAYAVFCCLPFLLFATFYKQIT